MKINITNELSVKLYLSRISSREFKKNVTGKKNRERKKDKNEITQT